jgi:hypothetical protein
MKMLQPEFEDFILYREDICICHCELSSEAIQNTGLPRRTLTSSPYGCPPRNDAAMYKLKISIKKVRLQQPHLLFIA